MKKLILMGRSESGKTTLKQALSGERIHYEKTQYIYNHDLLIDTPGEYAQTHHLGYALALYAYEADVVGLVVAATEPYTLFPPNIACMVNREVIGIITKIRDPGANVLLAERWLKNSGCKTIFRVDSATGEGVRDILDYLRGGQGIPEAGEETKDGAERVKKQRSRRKKDARKQHKTTPQALTCVDY